MPQGNFPSILLHGPDLAIGQMWTMADFSLQFRAGGRSGHPMDILHGKLPARMGQITVGMRDKKPVIAQVFPDDIPWSAAQPKALALTYGMKPDAVVGA